MFKASNLVFKNGYFLKMSHEEGRGLVKSVMYFLMAPYNNISVLRFN